MRGACGRHRSQGEEAPNDYPWDNVNTKIIKGNRGL